MLTTEAKNKMLDHLVGTTTLYLAGLTSVNPADEILTARKSVTFAAASGGSVVGNSDEDLVITAGTTVSHIALYDAVTGGLLLGRFPLTVLESFGSEGTLKVQNLTIELT